MREEYKARVCSREAAYEQGMNDGREEKPKNSGFSSVCDPQDRKGVAQGYREGYEAAVKAANQPGVKIDAGGVRVKAPGVDITIPNHGSHQWVCRKRIFGDTFTAYGATRGDASGAVREKCEKKNHPMHCDDPDCEENR
jgi:hypothetical protein